MLYLEWVPFARVRGTALRGLMHIADRYANLSGLAGVDLFDAMGAKVGIPQVADELGMWRRRVSLARTPPTHGARSLYRPSALCRVTGSC